MASSARDEPLSLVAVGAVEREAELSERIQEIASGIGCLRRGRDDERERDQHAHEDDARDGLKMEIDIAVATI